MHDDKDNNSPEDDAAREFSQIPLLNEIVFDSSLPLKAPSSPKRPTPAQQDKDHGPDYDPDTLDLFEDSAARFQSFVNDHAEEELRAGANQMIENLVEEYSAEITRRLREELNDQLQAILEDLNTSPKDE